MSIDKKNIGGFIRRYGKNESSLIQVLQDVQGEYGYLPKEALEYVGESLGVPLSRVYHVATFYAAFSLVPKGRHQIYVCMGTACHVRGAKMIGEKVCRDLKVESGRTTEDGEWSVDEVACIGACAIGPVIVADGEVLGGMTQSKFDRFLRRHKRAQKTAGGNGAGKRKAKGKARPAAKAGAPGSAPARKAGRGKPVGKTAAHKSRKS